MTPERRASIDYARGLVRSAKWRHRGRKPWAVDCVGLIVLSLREAGSGVEDAHHYSREPWRGKLQEHLRTRFGNPIAIEDAQPGDIAVFKWPGKEPSHIGMFGDYLHGGLSLIHAHINLGVQEHAFDAKWQRLLVEVYSPWQT